VRGRRRALRPGSREAQQAEAQDDRARGHDALARTAGAPTRYFPADAVPRPASLQALAAWIRELQRIARHAEHPWHEGLMADALVARAHAVLAPNVSRPGRGTFDTLGP